MKKDTFNIVKLNEQYEIFCISLRTIEKYNINYNYR